jgi:cytochrome o ubiquinol oxidase subunit 1
LAFGPLYVLGFMGATRRLDHYDASLGWQPLFIVAGIGALIIMVGVLFQVIQIIVSIRERHHNLDLTGDPWNGHTLEWSVPSPAPSYNFATLPIVHSRDAFWAQKDAGMKAPTEYTDIEMPKNSALGIVLSGLVGIGGFGVVWHMWWLAALGLLGAVVVFIMRAMDEHTEMIIPASVVRAEEERLAFRTTRT